MGFLSTQNMNFKSRPLLLLVMDQRALLRSREQRKMVRGHIQIEFKCWIQAESLWKRISSELFFFGRREWNRSLSRTLLTFRVKRVSFFWRFFRQQKKALFLLILCRKCLIIWMCKLQMGSMRDLCHFHVLGYLVWQFTKGKSFETKKKPGNIALFGLVCVRFLRFQILNIFFVIVKGT